MNISIQEGDTIQFKHNDTKYRIITIQPDYLSLCRMNTTRLDIIILSKESLFNLIENDDVFVEQRTASCFIDYSSMSDVTLSDYETKKAVFNAVKSLYGPYYDELVGKKPKTELYEILKKYNVSKSAFWRICIRYLQSGFDENALIDQRVHGNSKGKNCYRKMKPGIKSVYLKNTGIVIDETICKIFDDAIRDYKSGRQKTLRSAYDKMNNIHFTRIEIVNGVTSLVLLPVNERPTIKQFYYYARKKISVEEKEIIKTSRMEYRNNKRLINSDTLYGVSGPGDLVEIDACEADVSLVSSIDRSKTIGRPIVYFMIDVYTRIILAVSIAYDNNSLLGITNLFLNLADDKNEFCARYGMSFDDERIWPSNILPNRLRVDRGPEFKSKEFARICLALEIEKDIVPGGSGSLKGVIEQSFHQMHSKQNVHLEDKGLIEKRYDSRHHEEATLTIEDYTRVVINFILTHNQQYLETYPITKDMTEKKVLAIPAALWEYGINNCMIPRPIRDYNQYCYDLMTPIKAKVSRQGIEYEGLFYISDDPYLTNCRIKAGNKKIPFDARMDMRDVGAVYYISNGELIKAPLNEAFAGNADYKNLTMKQWEDYRKEKKRLNAEGVVHNQQLSSYNYLVNETVVSEAVRKSPQTIADKRNMRETREKEKQRISHANRIEERIDTPDEVLLVEEKPEPIKQSIAFAADTSIEERRLRRKTALLEFKDDVK